MLHFSNISFGQTLDRVKQDFNIETDYKSDNIIEDFKSFDFDFSNVWTITENENIFGIIGNDHQRIQIKLISIFRISNSPFLYNVYGKSKKGKATVGGFSAADSNWFPRNHSAFDFTIPKNRLWAAIYILRMEETYEMKMDRYLNTKK